MLPSKTINDTRSISSAPQTGPRGRTLQGPGLAKERGATALPTRSSDQLTERTCAGRCLIVPRSAIHPNQVRRFGHTVLFMVIAMDAPQIGSPHTPQNPGKPGNWGSAWGHSPRTRVSCERCLRPTRRLTGSQKAGVTRFHV